MPSSDSAPHSISAVLFDYGLVLSGPEDPAAWKRMRDFFRADDAAFHAAYWGPRLDYDRGTLTGEGFWRQLAKGFGTQLDAAQLHELMADDIALWGQPNQPM